MKIPLSRMNPKTYHTDARQKEKGKRQKKTSRAPDPCIAAPPALV
jgi:hypothetical protein